MFSADTTPSGMPLIEGAEGNPEAALALALRLMGYGLNFPGYEKPMRLLIGRLPDPMLVPLPLPEGVRIAGSQISGPITTIVLDADQSPSAVLGFYQERLPADGWKLQEPHGLHGGFTSGAFIRPLTFYKAVRGPIISVQATAREDGSTDVRLHLNTDPRQSFSAARRHQYDLLPSLAPPPSISAWPQGGGGGGDTYYSTTTLRTDLEAAVVSAHYVGQLRAAGWTLTGEGQGGPAAWSTWKLMDQDGEDWRGLLLVLHLPDTESAYMLYLRADIVQGPHWGG